jgi:hypothetical protein
MMKRMMLSIATAALVGIVWTGNVTAAGWGPRLGLTVDPDQVHFGAHVDAGYLADQLRFQPNFEMGIGNDMTLAAFNFDMLYLFNSRLDAWRPYMGGGAAANIVDRNDSRRNDSDLEAGLNLVGGIERSLSSGGRFLTELRLGLIDTPDLKWTVGWTFQH